MHNWVKTMDSNEKNLDNSLEGAMNMSQEDIERFLEQQQNQGQEDGFHFDDADLASLLSDLEASDDGDIQEISNLLNRADNNEAVDEDVIAFMKQQEAEGQRAYDAMDLFSNGEAEEKKEGFFKRLLKKISKKKENKEIKADKEIAEEETASEKPEEPVEIPAEKGKEKKKKEKKKEKKPKKTKEEKQTPKIEEVEEGEESIAEKPASKSKKVKDKKTKEKKSKEKKPKEKKVKEKKIPEKKADEGTADLLEEVEELPHKKKIIMIFLACIMLMIGFLIVNHYYTGYANKQLAQEAYEAEDYLECYQLLYGQKLNESQSVMFHRSELILKMNIFWNHYRDFVAEDRLLESLDKLVQFVYEYPELSAYAAEWNCISTVEDTYGQVTDILKEEYQVSEQEVMDIAALEKDEDYTSELLKLVETKQERNALEAEYPDILPEEEERITQGQ